MLKSLSGLQLAGIVVSVIWFIGISAFVAMEWNHRSTERAGLYRQCLLETPDVAECRSLRSATAQEDFKDVAVDFLVAEIAPIAVLWLALWLVQRRSRGARSA
jgi:hypothetical protein